MIPASPTWRLQWGLPCIVLWADTLEEIWRPQGERLVILKETTGVQAISVEKVMNELRRLILALSGQGARAGNDGEKQAR